MISDIEKLLFEHPFFEGMDPSACTSLGACAKHEVFNKNAFVFREGEVADRFFLVRRGVVAIEMHTPERVPMELATIHDGEAFGWSWVPHL